MTDKVKENVKFDEPILYIRVYNIRSNIGLSAGSLGDNLYIPKRETLL